MEKGTLKPYLVIIGLLLLASLALAFTVRVDVTNQAGVRETLPAQVGSWIGEDIRYCQSPSCGRVFVVSQLEDTNICPVCGSALGGMTFGEKGVLPDDTLNVKKRYTSPSGNVIHTTLVMSGKDRGSIHRPEVCLVSQGRKIDGRHTISVPLPGRDDLEVMLLDLSDETRLPDGRRGPDLYSYYAYWFVGKGRETPRHAERIFWMGYDRVFRNVGHRWAYLSLGGGRQPGSKAHEKVLSDFIRDFYPQMELDNPAS